MKSYFVEVLDGGVYYGPAKMVHLLGLREHLGRWVGRMALAIDAEIDSPIEKRALYKVLGELVREFDL